MKKETTVEKTKATLVREVEQKFRLSKGTLDSLERANKETIVKLLALQGQMLRTRYGGFFVSKIDSKCLLSLQRVQDLPFEKI